MIHTFQPRRFAGPALLALSLFVALPAMAGDYGCDIPCDTCPCEIGACDGCDSCPSGGKGNCFTNGFKKLSGHSNAGFCKIRDQFKKMCSVDFSCFKLGGKGSQCDDACDAAMMGEMMQGAQPVIEYRSGPAPNSIDHFPQVTPMPSPSSHVPEPIRMNRVKTDEELFETLPDPFLDDEVKVSIPSMVQPSSYNEMVIRPVPRRPLPRSH